MAEQAIAARRLRRLVARMAAPLSNRRFILEKGQRQIFAGLSQALEAFDTDKAGHNLQFRAQPGGMVQIGLQSALGRFHLKNHRDHAAAST